VILSIVYLFIHLPKVYKCNNNSEQNKQYGKATPDALVTAQIN